LYHPTTRVLTVLELLQTHGRMTGPAIAERLEVDGRTVRRYVTMLTDLGVPVEAIRGRAGGYRLRPGYKLPPLMLSDDEALAVTLGLHAARRMGLALAAPAVEGSLAKLERVLPAQVRAKVEGVVATLVTDLPGPSAKAASPQAAIVALLGEAIGEQRRVRLRYADWQGTPSEREVDPYGIAYVTGRWFTAGWCHLRRDMRTFRLDRVRSVDLLADRFTPPEGFDALAFVHRTLALSPACWEIEVRLDLPVAEAAERVPPAFADVAPDPHDPDRHSLLRCTANDLDFVARQLMNLCCAIEIVAPQELADAFTRLANRAAGIAHTAIKQSPDA
jgi:predicted DNA-binding transcriptional regulator YafY